ncbi:MAG: peptidoglycan-binding protein [Planctomycetes bacterium]|nr:peptidoglycan-binding protein [Planctomycetota bacterium]
MADPRKIVVQPGDHIAKIAADNCLSDWRTIWEASADVREKRKNPHMLCPGDVLTVPVSPDGEESGQTEKTHPFQSPGQPLTLRIRILHPDCAAVADAPFTLEIPGMIVKRKNDKGEEEDATVDSIAGKTDAEGNLKPDTDFALPPGATQGKLTVNVPAPADAAEPGGPSTLVWELSIGSLRPIADSDSSGEPMIAGVQQRLNNLGFDCGEVTGKMNEAKPEEDPTAQAIRSFCAKFGLSERSKPDEEFRRRLAEVHDDLSYRFERERAQRPQG